MNMVQTLPSFPLQPPTNTSRPVSVVKLPSLDIFRIFEGRRSI